MAKMSTLTLKNYQLVRLTNWLSSLILVGKQSRARTRFIKLVRERLEEIDAEHKKLLEQYVNKTTEGALAQKDVLSPDGAVVLRRKEWDFLNDDAKASYLKEYNEYMSEDFSLDMTKEREETMLLVKMTVLNTSDTFRDEQDNPAAALYSEWCDALDALK